MSKEVAKLKAEMRQVKQEKSTTASILYYQQQKNLRTADGKQGCNICKRVIHTAKVCLQSNRSYQPRGYKNQCNWGNNFINQNYQGRLQGQQQMDFNNRASWRYQQPFYDPLNQPYPQDGIY